MYKVDTIITVDPNELKFDASNRIADERHVARLKSALQEENLLHVNPIKINTKGIIIDGQHRCKAAIELGLKFVTCLVVSASIHDAQRLNQNSKNWNSLDFANYWAKEGKKPYQDFIDFVAITGIVPSVCIEILSSGGGRHMRNFKKGAFSVPHIETAYRFIDKLEGFKELLPRDYNKRGFIRALWNVVNNKAFHYDHKRMLHKAQVVGLRTAASTEGYLEQLENAYNWKVRDKVRFV